MIKLSVNLPDEVVSDIKSISLEDNVTMTSIIREALYLKRVIHNHVKTGHKVYIENKSGDKKEIILLK